MDSSQPVKKNILHNERTTTDKLFLGIFTLTFLTWIFIGSYAWALGDSSKIFPSKDKIKEFFTVSRFLIIMGYILCSGLLSIAIFIIMRWFKYFSLVFFLSMMVPVVVCNVTVMFYPNFFLIYGCIASFCSLLGTIFLVIYRWFYLSDAIRKQFCKVVLSFPIIVLFLLICSTLCVLAAFFGITVELHLNTLILPDDTLPPYIRFFSVVNTTACIWVLLFIFNFGQMILSATFATWFWTENKAGLTNNIVWQCFKFTSRYHLGTIAYSSSIFAVLYCIIIILLYVVHKLREGNNSAKSIIILLFVPLYSIFDGGVIRFIIYSSIYSCAVDGKSFRQSIKDLSQYCIKHSIRCMLATKIGEYLVLAIVGIMAIGMYIILSPYMKTLPSSSPGDYNWKFMFVIAVSSGSLIFILPLIQMTVAGHNAFLMCCVEDLEAFEFNDEEDSLDMNTELKNAFNNNDGPPTYFYQCMVVLNTLVVAERMTSNFATV